MRFVATESLFMIRRRSNDTLIDEKQPLALERIRFDLMKKQQKNLHLPAISALNVSDVRNAS